MPVFAKMKSHVTQFRSKKKVVRDMHLMVVINKDFIGHLKPKV